MGTGAVSTERDRKKLRTALITGLIALVSLLLFIYNVWQRG
jgi:uncharacterized membrane protein (GlpM family)